MIEIANLGVDVLLFPDVARHHIVTKVYQLTNRSVSQVSGDALIGYQETMASTYILEARK